MGVECLYGLNVDRTGLLEAVDTVLFLAWGGRSFRTTPTVTFSASARGSSTTILGEASDGVWITGLMIVPMILGSGRDFSAPWDVVAVAVADGWARSSGGMSMSGPLLEIGLITTAVTLR